MGVAKNKKKKLSFSGKTHNISIQKCKSCFHIHINVKTVHEGKFTTGKSTRTKGELKQLFCKHTLKAKHLYATSSWPVHLEY